MNLVSVVFGYFYDAIILTRWMHQKRQFRYLSHTTSSTLAVRLVVILLTLRLNLSKLDATIHEANILLILKAALAGRFQPNLS